MDRHSTPKLAILSLAIGCCLNNVAFSCQCGERPGPAIAFDRAVVVFAGEVTSVRETPFPMPVGVSDLTLVQVRYVRVKVGRIFKGPACSEIAFVGSSNCDYQFREGRSYVIYLQADHSLAGAFTASVCLPTKPLDEAERDMEVLEAKTREAKRK